MKQTELDKLLQKHRIWLLSSQEEGEPFSASGLVFIDTNTGESLKFNQANLVGGNLVGCNFSGCDLSGTNMESLNLSESIFNGTDLRGAKLRKCDMRYCEIDEHTQFLGAITTGMLVDENLFALLKEDEVDKNNLERVNINSVEFSLRFKNQEEAYICKELTDCFVAFITERFDNSKSINSSVSSSPNRIVCTINTSDKVTKDDIEETRKLFTSYLSGNASIQELTPDKLQQSMIQWRIKRLMLDYEQNKGFLEEKTRLLAEKHNQMVVLRNENEDIKAQLNTLVLSFATQMTNQPRMIAGGAALTLKLIDNSAQQINAEDVVFAEKSWEGLMLYLRGIEKPLPIKSTVDDLAAKLQSRNPFIFKCHKSYILNVKMVENHRNNHKVIEVKPLHFSNMIIVSEGHKETFRQLFEKVTS
jgi:hypothetical protein